jgi:hypothetical protein
MVDAAGAQRATICTSNGNINGMEVNTCFFNSPLELIFWIIYVLKEASDGINTVDHEVVIENVITAGLISLQHLSTYC